MVFMRIQLLTLLLLISAVFISPAQSIELSTDFRLASPYHEPDGANDVVRLKGGDFITLAKLKGGISGKADFALERNHGQSFNVLWTKTISISTVEEFKDLYFNGKDLVLLSVIHDQVAKTTKLISYGYNVQDGTQLWTKELESYAVTPYVDVDHRGTVKESFIDVICEHTTPSFVTPFEYKHNIHFSPDESKFVSYVFDFSQHTLSASITVYDNACNVLNKGKVTIDNGYVNFGIYINNRGQLFIINANNIGKVNVIRMNLETREFDVVEIPGSNYKKDELLAHFINDDILYIGAVELYEEKIIGVTYARVNFQTMQLDKNSFDKFDNAVFSVVAEGRKTNKNIKGDENWIDYDLSHMFVSESEEVIMVIEKRSFYADGYPHIAPSTFDKKHQVELNGHVHTEGIIMLSYAKDNKRSWVQYIAKNQVYPSTDGLNTISYVIDNTHHSDIRIMYATSESMDGSITTINLVHIDRSSGKKVKEVILPNESKLMIVRDYTLWEENDKLILVGRKGITGKTSAIVRYKL